MYKVIIVDDEPFIREGLKQIVNWEEHGIEIAGEASNGFEALNLIKIMKPNLLLTDIKMPLMDGLQLISTVRKQGINLKTIVISGYDDFQMVKEALKYGIENYLVKPINADELSLTLQNTIEKIGSEAYAKVISRENEFVIRDNLLNRLIKNHISPREFREKATIINININMNDSLFMVAIVKVLNKNTDKFNNTHIREFAVMNILDETISEFFSCSLVQDLSGDIIIIFHDPALKDKMQSVNEILYKSIDNINSFLRVDLFITMGEIQKAIESLYLSYEKAMDLMQYFLIYPLNSIITPEKLNNQLKKSHEIYDVSLEKLIDMILYREREQIIHFFDDLHAKLSKATFLTYEYVQILLIEFLSYFFNIIKSNDLGTDYEIIFSKILKLKAFDEIFIALKNVSIEIADKIHLNRERPKTWIESVIEFVNLNYYKTDISLKTLSVQFHMTAPYLGQLFKNSTGELFSGYLNNIRIEKAKLMLKSTHFKANEVSEKVGYADSNYFYKIFKKHTGLYPSEYREEFNE